MRRRLFLVGLLAAPWSAALAVDAPALMLARVYRSGRSLDGFWVSEKFDGVRERWDGKRLITRSGETVVAPEGFTRGWPNGAMDGELWAGRGRFEDTLSIVRTLQPDREAWRQIRFMVFDLPDHPGTFTERIAAYRALTQSVNQPWLQPVPQERVASEAALMTRLKAVEQAGGEGLMLHHGDARYVTRRSDDLLKLKSFDDAEATVLGQVPGKGRLQGRMGALWVQTPDGRRFKLGTGFTDAQRAEPPPVGSLVTYRHQGFNSSGLPRFAVFVRVRQDRLRP